MVDQTNTKLKTEKIGEIKLSAMHFEEGRFLPCTNLLSEFIIFNNH